MSLRSVGITRGRLDARRVRHLLERMAKPPDPNDPHAVLQDALDAMLRDRPFASTAEVQSFLEAEVRALTVNAALSPNDIGDPEYMHNAVALLTTLRDDGPAKATAAGNLSRDFVARMLPRMRFREGYLDDLRRMNKVINESDVWPLEMMRHLLLIAGLVKRHKGFRISPAGREMLDPARRGELFALLFRTFFRRLDLGAMDSIEGQVGLQHTIAFTFWKVRSAAESWTTPVKLAHVAWLESAKDRPLDNPVFPDEDRREWAFSARVVEPLIRFGLLESRNSELLCAMDRFPVTAPRTTS